MRISRRVLVPSVIALTLCAGIGFALYLSNLEIQGTFNTTAGTQPTDVLFTENVEITAGENTTVELVFDNPNGDVLYSFLWNDTAIVSTDPKCNYESLEDIIVTLASNGYSPQPLDTVNPITVPFVAGENNITVEFSASEYACPNTGLYSIIGTLTS